MLSPVLFLPYLALALVVTAIAARKATTRWRKFGAVIGSIVFFWAFGHIDDIFGGIEHKWLCHSQAGFKVYKQVKLPPDLYDSRGKPKFITDTGPDRTMLAPHVRFDKWDVNEYSRFFVPIKKFHMRVVDEKTAALYAERIDFARWPSTFLPTISHESATGCFGAEEQEKLSRDWYRELFGTY